MIDIEKLKKYFQERSPVSVSKKHRYDSLDENFFKEKVKHFPDAIRRYSGLQIPNDEIENATEAFLLLEENVETSNDFCTSILQNNLDDSLAFMKVSTLKSIDKLKELYPEWFEKYFTNAND